MPSVLAHAPRALPARCALRRAPAPPARRAFAAAAPSDQARRESIGAVQKATQLASALAVAAVLVRSRAAELAPSWRHAALLRPWRLWRYNAVSGVHRVQPFLSV